MSSDGVQECPNCGAPMRNGVCNYCKSQDLLRDAYSENGRCRNCGADLSKDGLVRDAQNWLICRYCGWPIRQKSSKAIATSTVDGPSPSSSVPALNSILSAGLGLVFMSVFAIVILAILGGFVGFSGIWPTSNVTKITTNIAGSIVQAAGVFLTAIGALAA